MSRGQTVSQLDGVAVQVQAGRSPSHKQYKLRFLKAEETQRSQWGEIDVFRRYGQTEKRYGFLPSEHASYFDYNYADLRGWKRIEHSD